MKWLRDRFRRQPVLERYEDFVFPSAEAEHGALRVRFFGVSTLLFEDGDTSILIDGFFTRPGYAVLITHDGAEGRKTMLVQGSGGFTPGALKDRDADVVFLGVGTLGKLQQSYLSNYWCEVVETVGARRIFPIHWDDFFESIDRPLAPMPRLLDNFDKTMRFLLQRGHERHVEVKLLPTLLRVDPFAGLELRFE